jgi:hypothetical protein
MNFVIRNSEGTFVAEGDQLELLLEAARKFELSQSTKAWAPPELKLGLTPREKLLYEYEAEIHAVSQLDAKIGQLQIERANHVDTRNRLGVALSKEIQAGNGVVYNGYFYKYIGSGMPPERTKVMP